MRYTFQIAFEAEDDREAYDKTIPWATCVEQSDTKAEVMLMAWDGRVMFGHITPRKPDVPE
jgi:hypothetical protein